MHLQNGRVSPRAGSQQSVHSGGAASDKASRASASPRHHLAIVSLPGIKAESATPRPQQSTSSNLTASGQTALSPQGGREGHAAQMEGASGVPERVEEVMEPV